MRLEIRRIPHFGQNSITNTTSSATLLHSQLLNIFFPDTPSNQYAKRLQLHPINAQKAWKENATATSLKNFPNALDYVNYHGKLTLQKNCHRYYVIYTGSGSHIAAAVVDISKKRTFQVGKNKIKSNGFIADYTTFWYATNDLDEANYLTTILNSNTMNRLIKEHQPKGKFGPRHICRLPFEFNIPKFNDQNDLHLKIAKLGQKAAIEADKLPIMSRTKIKKAIPIMSEIDDAVSKLML